GFGRLDQATTASITRDMQIPESTVDSILSQLSAGNRRNLEQAWQATRVQNVRVLEGEKDEASYYEVRFTTVDRASGKATHHRSFFFEGFGYGEIVNLAFTSPSEALFSMNELLEGVTPATGMEPESTP